MDMNINKFLLLLIFTGVQLGLTPTESTFSLSAKIKKNCFLTFHAPPKLRFHESPAVADRSNLLMLGDPVSNVTEVSLSEKNSTAELGDFPLTSYNEVENESAITEQTELQDLLPPADPFDNYSLGSSSVDSTDQLIELFENLEKSGTQPSRVSVNFIPPFSTDNGNFTIESRASYTRRVRP